MILGKAHRCKGFDCTEVCYGQRQLCDACYAKRLLCRQCGLPHGGQAGTTRLCDLCRRGKKSKPRSERNPAWTPEEDALVRQAYAECNAHEVGPRLVELFPTRPRWSLKRRASQIGCATIRKKEAPWSAEEIALLQEVSWMVPDRIAQKFRERGFHRTVTAIAIRRNRTHTRDHIDGMTASGLAKTLAVDVHAVTKWIEKGWLRAELAGERNDGQQRRHVPTAAIRAFLLEHPECVELGKLERAGSKMWYLEMVTGGQIREDGAPTHDAASTAATMPPTPERTVPLAGERVTLTALADICGRAVGDLVHRIDGLGMSVDEAAFGKAGAPAPPAAVSPPASGPAEIPPPAGEPSPLSLAIATQVRALMRHHRAGVTTVAQWAGLPVEVVRRVLDGTTPLVSPPLLAIVLKLGGHLRLDVTPST